MTRRIEADSLPTQIMDQSQPLETERGSGISIGIHYAQEEITNKYIGNLGIVTRRGPLTEERVLETIGIETRFRAAEHETVGFMAREASKDALQGSTDVDAIIFLTTRPTGQDEIAALEQELNLQNVDKKLSMPIYAACAGFGRALTYIKENEKAFWGKRVVIASGEDYSRFVEKLEDQGDGKENPVLDGAVFSDQGSAIVFTYGVDFVIHSRENFPFPEEHDTITTPFDEGLLSVREPYIYEPPQGVVNSQIFSQNGSRVFKTVVRRIPSCIIYVVEKAGMTMNDIDLINPHQPTGTTVNALAEAMGSHEDKVIKDAEKGNSSSGSAIRAWARANSEGRIKPGTKMVVIGFGTGMFAAGAVLEIMPSQETIEMFEENLDLALAA